MSHKPILTSASLYEQGAPIQPRRLVAAGIKRGAGPLVVEQPQQSAADKAAHVAASYVRLPAMTS